MITTGIQQADYEGGIREPDYIIFFSNETTSEKKMKYKYLHRNYINEKKNITRPLGECLEDFCQDEICRERRII